MLVPFRKSLCLIFIGIAPVWGLPTGAFGADPVGTGPKISNAQRQVLTEAEAGIEPVPVTLGKDRMLKGTVKTKEGTIAAGATVVLGVDGRPVGRVLTDDQGQFTFGPISPGKYQLASRDAVAMITVHSLDSAPEDAAKTIEVSQPAMIARGQSPGGFFTNPWFIGLIVAAAIAIPLAIVLSDDDDAS
jgi:hypothetical protein